MNELLKQYKNKQGDIVVIRKMDDYYLRNAINYAFRRLKAVNDFVKWMSDKMEAMDSWEKEYFCEEHDWAHHLQVQQDLPIWIESMMQEAASRGTMSTCSNCKGKRELIVNKRTVPCLICCGTGWVMRGVRR